MPNWPPGGRREREADSPNWGIASSGDAQTVSRACQEREVDPPNWGFTSSDNVRIATRTIESECRAL